MNVGPPGGRPPGCSCRPRSRSAAFVTCVADSSPVSLLEARLKTTPAGGDGSKLERFALGPFIEHLGKPFLNQAAKGDALLPCQLFTPLLVPNSQLRAMAVFFIPRPCAGILIAVTWFAAVATASRGGAIPGLDQALDGGGLCPGGR